MMRKLHNLLLSTVIFATALTACSTKTESTSFVKSQTTNHTAIKDLTAKENAVNPMMFDTTQDKNVEKITDFQVLSLPKGFAPDGISIAKDGTIFVASIADGKIVKGKTDESQITEILVESGQKAGGWGMDLTTNDKYLWVAGGFSGTARSYDADTGKLVSDIHIANGGIVNDLIVTNHAVYLTNSALPELYEIPLDSDGTIAGEPRTIKLSGDFDFDASYFANANGIDYDTKSGMVIVNHSQLGKMYSIDTKTGVATEIDLNGETVSNDGIALDGAMLYGVEAPKNQVAEIKLSDDLSEATVTRRFTADIFNFPTLIAYDDAYFYIVNGKLSTKRTPDVPYEVIKIAR